MQEKIQQLKSLLPKLGPKDATFASDLIYSYKKYGKLSDKQGPWVDKLIDRALNPEVEKTKLQVEVGGFQGVIALFQKAQQHLKHPRIALSCLGEKLIFSLAGPQSKAPGSVSVAGEGQYPDRKWFGRVSPAGLWEPANGLSTEMFDALQKLLTEFANDPARVAKKYGKLTGLCCFCVSPLTDKRSTAAGFGPVCAKHYGLEDEWKSAVKKMEEQEAGIMPAPIGVIGSMVMEGVAMEGKLPRKPPTAEVNPMCSMCRRLPVSDVLEGIPVCASCKAVLVA